MSLQRFISDWEKNLVSEELVDVRLKLRIEKIFNPDFEINLQNIFDYLNKLEIKRIINYYKNKEKNKQLKIK